MLTLSVVRIITPLKKPAGHSVASVTPQLVGSWGLAGKHDILSQGYTGRLCMCVAASVVITFGVFNHSSVRLLSVHGRWA